MTTDTLRTEANERVDLEDFFFATDASLRNNAKHWGEQFFSDPTKDRSWILNGFDMSGVGGLPSAQFQVDLGRAILGSRRGGETFYGSLVSEGDTQRIIDVSTYSAATYGVYVRFELIDGESSSRAFWDPQGTGSEIAQTIPTRRLANWSLRLELSTPGAEWLKIGEAVVDATPEVTTITEQRDFYFEGEEHNTYESGWSAEGGGVANDRNSDRQQYGVFDFHTFTQATRQCLEDLKGRGLRRWWDKGIGGMNVGFDDDPVEDRIAIGDVDFCLDLSGDPIIYFDDISGANKALFKYLRVAERFEWHLLTLTEMLLTTSGLTVGKGGVFGHGLTAVDDRLSVGDAAFCLDFTDSNVPTICFTDPGGVNEAGLYYNRSTNRFKFSIKDSVAVQIEEDTPGSPTLRALDPVASSDDGGDLIFKGGNSGADADKDGGNAILSGGDATGSGASSVFVKVATRAGAGVAARVPEDYITARGDLLAGSVLYGLVQIKKPVSIAVLAGDADGLLISSGGSDGHVLNLIGDLTSPVKSVIGMSPQDSDPSAPSNGSIYPNSVTDQLCHYSAVLGRFQAMDTLVYQKPGDIAETDASNVEQVWDDGSPVKCVIPADTLRIGSVIKFRAWGKFDAAAADTWACRIRMGTNAEMTATPPTGKIIAVITGENFNIDQPWDMQGEALVKSLGGTALLFWTGSGGSTRIDLTVPLGPFVISDQSSTIATDAPLEIAPTLDFGAAAQGNAMRLYGFTVEVL